MPVAQLTNISSGVVTVQLADGSIVQLPPGGVLMNVTVTNLSGIQNLLRVVYKLND